MNTLVKYITGKVQCYDVGLLLLRLLPTYYMLTNHGWNKIINPEKWSKLGNSFTKYFGDLIDFANPMFGFLASFSESVGAILILLGLFTQPAAVLLSLTMLFAALYHITGTGNPESALIYFSIFLTISFTGPGKYSLDSKFSSNNKN
jgi:putative oxidoreductase